MSKDVDEEVSAQDVSRNLTIGIGLKSWAGEYLQDVARTHQNRVGYLVGEFLGFHNRSKFLPCRLYGSDVSLFLD